MHSAPLRISGTMRECDKFLQSCLHDSGDCDNQTLLARCKMALLRWSSFKETADLVSSILNWVCPECGGRMGGHGYEFKCQGECQTDWRPLWEQNLSVGSHRQSQSTLGLT
jgi:hypothetical protein